MDYRMCKFMMEVVQLDHKVHQQKLLLKLESRIALAYLIALEDLREKYG